MGLFMYSSVHAKHNSTQAYLGTVRVCPSCKSQRPKDSFKVVDGESICKPCQDELEAEESQ